MPGMVLTSFVTPRTGNLSKMALVFLKEGKTFYKMVDCTWQLKD